MTVLKCYQLQEGELKVNYTWETVAGNTISVYHISVIIMGLLGLVFKETRGENRNTKVPKLRRYSEGRKQNINFFDAESKFQVINWRSDFFLM